MDGLIDQFFGRNICWSNIILLENLLADTISAKNVFDRFLFPPNFFRTPEKDKILLCAISRVEKEDNIKRQQLADNAAIGQTIRNILLLLGKYFEEKISKIQPIFLLFIF